MSFASRLKPRSDHIHWGFVIVTIGLFLALFSTPLAGQSDQLAYWQLDEAEGVLYGDISGGNNASCIGDCPTPTVGQVGGGQQFNGSSTALDAPPNAAFDWGSTGSFSIELWVQSTVGQTCADSAETMIGRADPSTGMRWSLGCAAASGNATFHLFDESGQGLTLEGPAIHNGGWHHIVGIRNGDNNRNLLYVNGKEVAAAPITYTAGFAASTSVNIGWLNLDFGYHFEGALDEIALYNRVLTPTEIGSHYYLSQAYTELCTEPIRIMPLGDSITRGHNSGVSELEKQVSYRRDLWHSLHSSGYQVDFVGRLTNGEYYRPLDGFDPNHEGRSGFQDRQIANNIYNWLTSNPAHVILLHIGTNELNPDPGDVEHILNEIDRYDESITVVLARIVNRQTYSSMTTEFNNNIEAMARARIADGDKILIVDMENGAGIDYSQYPPGDMWDDVHPYATGYTKMAQVWHNTLAEFMPVCINSAPIITSEPMTAATIGQPYSYDVEASGNPAPTFALTIAPEGMSIDAITGFITWMPDSVGTFEVLVEASNSTGVANHSYMVTVYDSAQIPTITSTPVTEGWVGEYYSYDVESSGSPSPTYSLATAPVGMSIDADTGLIDWTPTAAGTYQVIVESVNSGGTASQTFTIYVMEHTQPPIITSVPITEAEVGLPYSYDVEASGTPAPSFALLTSPSGMSIDASTGLIAWTPTQGGLFSVTVKVTNSVGMNEQSFTVTVQEGREETMCPVDMVSYWPMDDAAGSTLFSDIQGGYDGSCSGTACPTAVNGLVAGALSFDGNDTVNVPYQTVFNWNNTDSFSIELWINTTQSCSGNKVFIGKYGGNSRSMAWWVGCGSEDAARFYVRDSNRTAVTIIGTTPINNGNWHHIVSVFDGSNRQNMLYVDGQLEASSPTNFAGNLVSTSNLNLGHYVNGSHYNGIMDEVAVYNRVLDAAEIGQHYANGVAGQSYCTVDETGESPLLSSAPVTAGTIGQPYSYHVEANGNPAPSFALIVAPLGMTIDAASGLIVWTPTYAGVFDVTVEAINSAGVDTQSFSITVSEPPQAPVIISTPIAEATVGQAYTYDVDASGNPPPSFALTVVPEGMTINAATGLIAWTPTNVGLFEVTVEAINSTGVVSQSFVINVHPAPQAPVITSEAVIEGMVGQSYIYDVEANGNPAPIFALIVAPAGMSIDAATGLITWVPDTAGAFDVTVEALNSIGPTTQSFTVNVAEEETEPPVFSTSPVVALVGELYQYQAQASGTPLPLYSLSIAPAGMSIESATGRVEWTPDLPGVFDVTIVAENRAGAISQSFKIQVIESMSASARISPSIPGVTPRQIDRIWLPIIIGDR